MSKLPFIIAVDFDGTLVQDEYPSIGAKIERVFNEVKRWKSHGHKIVLWTCRDGVQLQEAIDWCNQQGLYFDAVNENIIETKKMFNNDTRKVYANIYLDDKAIRPGLLDVFHNTDPTSIKPWRSKVK
jgi:hydroxymethylpyrimidine pyrophosphatase-like HAD family hydrolase